MVGVGVVCFEEPPQPERIRLDEARIVRPARRILPRSFFRSDGTKTDETRSIKIFLTRENGLD